ncbi:MAG: glycosyltransferase family 4 protein [Opitutae bacterium]|nr:glycosyltransferase family 4 protein [Opitutae bacterium]
MKHILYIKRGLFSYTNVSVDALLRREFPEYEMEVIDVQEDFLDKRPWIRWMNWLAVLLEYAPQIMSRTQHPQACYFRTPYIARIIHRHLPSLLKKPAEDYLFSFQTSSLYDASIAMNKDRIPNFIYTDHTHKTNLYYPTFDPDKLFSKKWVREEQHIYENAARIFTMSEHVRRSAIDHYNIPPKKVECVFAGSNTETDTRALDNDDFTNKRIVFVGVDWERKGGPELVNAFRILLRDYPDAVLDIVGCNPEINCPNVNVIGRVPLDEVKTFFRKSSVLCVPTKVEPFGIVFVEAFAHKIPVVSSNLGALPQIVEHGKSGFLCDPSDSTVMAKYLGDLISSPETCQRFGKYGYKRVQETLNWNSVGRIMAESIRNHLSD